MSNNKLHAIGIMSGTSLDGIDVSYVSSDGKSIRKTLMKTPIDGARLSSGFGRRMHPILGYSKMHKGLINQGLKPMEANGKDFDSEIHEAITKIPAPNEKLKGKVVDVIEKGYQIHEKVIRYAKVVVGE